MTPVPYCESAPQILDATVYNLSTEATLVEGPFDTILPFTLVCLPNGVSPFGYSN